MPAPPTSKEAQTGTSMLEEEENYPESGTSQEELNEIVDAFYGLSTDEDIQSYQHWVEDNQGERVAQQSLKEPSLAPSFQLEDQDGDTVCLSDLLEKGPVVLSFYHGKWSPHSNATLMRYGNELVPELEKSGASLVAISPMLPDGTAYLATKRDLNFAVCSDTENILAKRFGITFTVQPHNHPFMSKWGDDWPSHHGLQAGWDIPLPATFVIGQDGRIAWSHIDNDTGVAPELDNILHAVADVSGKYQDLMDIIRDSSCCEKKPHSRKLFNCSLSAGFPLETPKSLKMPSSFSLETPKSLKMLFSSFHASDTDSTGTCDSPDLDRSRHSVASEGGDGPRGRRNLLRTLRRNHSAKEGLGAYFFPPSA
ncbi:Putative peroxiredoxin bcp [Seminavis robusta]|uniref:thioredoxin-dependent peroxiredoxin n=1 Tax=Seminavis robusta TaxID=568900 RepID=A0A9N8E3R3_9STRA|nr:Putative peroxiredoxin bcp [Seminavis robusta]|eukprot:Sro588_g171520.1 Putative peroxiredoxin bcp (367) ;mRNA; f:29015-30115